MFDSGITFFYTEDLEKTTEFYIQVLQLPLALDQGGCRIFRINEGSFLGFCQRYVGSTTSSIITFVTDDVEAWAERLQSLGIKLEKPPTYNPDFRILHFFFKDPSGYLIEIQRFDDPDWKGLFCKDDRTDS